MHMHWAMGQVLLAVCTDDCQAPAPAVGALGCPDEGSRGLVFTPSNATSSQLAAFRLKATLLQLDFEFLQPKLSASSHSLSKRSSCA